jgi:hypothetical protein
LSQDRRRLQAEIVGELAGCEQALAHPPLAPVVARLNPPAAALDNEHLAQFVEKRPLAFERGRCGLTHNLDKVRRSRSGLTYKAVVALLTRCLSLTTLGRRSRRGR